MTSPLLTWVAVGISGVSLVLAVWAYVADVRQGMQFYGLRGAGLFALAAASWVLLLGIWWHLTWLVMLAWGIVGGAALGMLLARRAGWRQEGKR
jgi:hypothetical protein